MGTRTVGQLRKAVSEDWLLEPSTRLANRSTFKFNSLCSSSFPKLDRQVRKAFKLLAHHLLLERGQWLELVVVVKTNQPECCFADVGAELNAIQLSGRAHGGLLCQKFDVNIAKARRQIVIPSVSVNIFFL